MHAARRIAALGLRQFEHLAVTDLVGGSGHARGRGALAAVREAGVRALVEVEDHVPVVAALARTLQVVEAADGAQGEASRALGALVGCPLLRVPELRLVTAVRHAHLPREGGAGVSDVGRGLRVE